MTAAVIAARYRLRERVGLGGMSEVWAADDLELGRSVALKLVAPDADRERFEREAQAAARLSHPHICRLYDYGEADGRRYLVLELLEGGSLEDRLQPGQPLPDAEASRVATELASALAYAHEQGVLHRDVKPSNVLFDAEGTVKIVDFGIARVVGQPTLTEAGTVLGTALYISPEQTRGGPVTPATDVYSFGAVLYQLLTGRPPFEGTDALEIAAMHAANEPRRIRSLRPDAPEDLAAVAAAALAKRPEDRPADGHALLALLSGRSAALVEPATAVIPPAQERRRRIGPRQAAMAGAVVVLAIAGVGAAMLATPEQSRAPVTDTTRATTRPATSTVRTSTASPSTSTRATSAATTTAPRPATTRRTSTRAATTAPTTTAPATTTEPTTTEVTTTAATTTATTATTTTAATTTTPGG